MKAEIHAIIGSLNNDELAKQPGHVYQVWEDGEITMTKSGELLGCRNLHCMEWKLDVAIAKDNFPHQTSNGHGFAYVTKADAETIRNLIQTHGS